MEGHEPMPSTSRSLPLASSSTRLPVLDGLRSWVLLVMLAHFGNFDNPAPGALLQRGLLLVAQSAFVGLDVFFVLSGFLITRILLDAKGSTSYFQPFYLRRALRIFPVYYGTLIVYLLVLPNVVSWASISESQRILQWSYWVYLQNFVLASVLELSESSFVASLGHLWSLAVEEHFYLTWPAVVYYLSNQTLKKVCLSLLVVAAVVRIVIVGTGFGGSPAAAYPLTPARMDGLALGAYLALAAREARGLAIFRRWAKVVACGAVVVLAFIFVPLNEHGSASWVFLTVGLTASVYLSGAIVVLALYAPVGSFWRRCLESWPLRRIGQYSYATYVFHFPIAYIFNQTGVVTRIWFQNHVPIPLAAELAYCSVLMLTSIGLGALSWHLYEQPILRLRRYLPYHQTSAHFRTPDRDSV